MEPAALDAALNADLNAAIIAVARGHRHRAGVLLGELGLHPGQEQILMRLFDRGDWSQADLAASIRVEPPTVNRSLGSLERAGLLRRLPSAQDRRATTVELTEAGRALEPRLRASWRRLEEDTVAGLTGPERSELARLLTLAAGNLRSARPLSCDPS